MVKGALTACMSEVEFKEPVNGRTIVEPALTAYRSEVCSASASLAARHASVVGAGPCGIASVGRLIDAKFDVTWIDPSFTCGRMGTFYRNVPANTTNGDFVAGFRACTSFQFERDQRRRMTEVGGSPALSALPPESCADLGPFVDALEDAAAEMTTRATVLKGTVVSVFGEVDKDLLPWTLKVCDTDGSVSECSVDAVVLCTGAHPVVPPVSLSARISEHGMDLMVDPVFVCKLIASSPQLAEESWAVFGNSHSGMLVVKNLVEAGARRVVVFYKSELRYLTHMSEGFVRYPGSGLKGPVAAWCRENVPAGIGAGGSVVTSSGASIEFAMFDSNVSWSDQIKGVRVSHVVYALGFKRNMMKTSYQDGKVWPGAPPIAVRDAGAGQGSIIAVDVNNYNRDTGQIGPLPSLFGGGIAFPHNTTDAGGHTEPWVGFAFGIRNTESMISAWRHPGCFDEFY